MKRRWIDRVAHALALKEENDRLGREAMCLIHERRKNRRPKTERQEVLNNVTTLDAHRATRIDKR